MKVFSVFFFCVLIVFNATNTSLGMPLASNISSGDGYVTDELVFNVQPFKIILEHQLRVVKATKRTDSPQQKSQVSDINLKSIAKASDNSMKNICSEMELQKKAAPEEISEMFSDGTNFESNEASLQKIYDSLKDCDFVVVRSSKLWGPLWHCLNRLFLFFVFG